MEVTYGLPRPTGASAALLDREKSRDAATPGAREANEQSRPRSDSTDRQGSMRARAAEANQRQVEASVWRLLVCCPCVALPPCTYGTCIGH